jgi:hypothetical protein
LSYSPFLVVIGSSFDSEQVSQDSNEKVELKRLPPSVYQGVFSSKGHPSDVRISLKIARKTFTEYR